MHKMGEFEKRQIYENLGFKDDDKSYSDQIQWAFMETEDDVCKYDLIESSLDDSLDSSSSMEMMEDVSSSSSSSCSPLFDLSELMLQLPIKRGLSKFYQGKSESFASLASVKSIEDLEKKCKYSSCRSRSMKRYGQSQRLSPKATIAKNKKGFSSSSSSSTTTSRSPVFSSVGKMSSLMAN